MFSYATVKRRQNRIYIYQGVFFGNCRYSWVCTAIEDKLLSADDGQVCPRCGKALFRTGVSVKYIPSSDQTAAHGKPDINYDISEIEYEE